MERIQNKGNSSLLLQLAERVENAAEVRNPQSFRSQQVNQPSLNVVEMNMMTDVHGTVLEIKTMRDFFKMSGRVTVIKMASGLCNDSAIQEWNLSVFSKLVELVVDDNCLQFVKGLKLVGFVSLERVAIGMKCMCESEGCFEMSDCEKLKSVVMGGGCCVKWNSFVMRNCGVIEVSIGDGCFVNCENTVFESLSALTKLIVGNEAFRGNEKKSALVMKSECCERE